MGVAPNANIFLCNVVTKNEAFSFLTYLEPMSIMNYEVRLFVCVFTLMALCIGTLIYTDGVTASSFLGSRAERL